MMIDEIDDRICIHIRTCSGPKYNIKTKTTKTKTILEENPKMPIIIIIIIIIMNLFQALP